MPQRGFMSLLSYFIKPTDNARASKTPDQGTTTISAPPPPPPSKLQQTIGDVLPSTGVAAVDQKFIAHFTDVMSKSDQSGPDFFEFMQSLNNMEKLGFTEDKAYQAAWAGFAALVRNADPSILDTSAQKYITALQKDKEDFNAEVQNALVNDLGDLKKKITTLESQSKDSADQILKLQAQISANNDTVAKLNGQISEKTIKITNGQKSYAVTFDAFLNRINDTLSKTKQYIGGNN